MILSVMTDEFQIAEMILMAILCNGNGWVQTDNNDCGVDGDDNVHDDYVDVGND